METTLNRSFRFDELFGNPFAPKREETQKAQPDEFVYQPSAYCRLMDEMIGQQSRPWNPRRTPTIPKQVISNFSYFHIS